jgi:hypothetical protein
MIESPAQKKFLVKSTVEVGHFRPPPKNDLLVSRLLIFYKVETCTKIHHLFFYFYFFNPVLFYHTQETK